MDPRRRQEPRQDARSPHGTFEPPILLSTTLETVTLRAKHHIRAKLKALGADHGYLVVFNAGFTDRNRYDYALPHADYPVVYKALHQAVTAAEREATDDYPLKILALDATGPELAAEVVWRSYTL